MEFWAHNRLELFGHQEDVPYDIIIIGGGITGAGIALDAALRGFKTLLIEKNDFASGTSSKSTKLIHGGLRYLKQMEFALVREVGLERAILHNMLPHLVLPGKMLLPIVENGSLGKYSTNAALWVYDYLAQVDKEDKKKMLNKEETLEAEPLLYSENVKSGALYAEYKTDDARLTLELLKAASTQGAICMNYCEAKHFVMGNENESHTVEIKDYLSDQTIKAKAKCIINASGPWTDKVLNINKGKLSNKIFLSKGVHLVIDRTKLPLQQSIYFDIGDGRMMFAIPRLNKIYFGTTDTAYTGDIDDVRTDRDDALYLIKALNRQFTNANINLDDIESSWAGLRPLIRKEGQSSTEMSRKDEVFISPDGLISIAGGKLTGYRKMAERVVDLAEEQLRGKKSPCKTANYSFRCKSIEKYSEEDYYHVNYGSAARQFLDGIDKGNKEKRLYAELNYCIMHESCTSPLDYFARRSGRLYFDINGVKEDLDICLDYFSTAFNWAAERIERERELVLTQIRILSLEDIKKASQV